MRKNLLFIAGFPPPYHGANVDNKNIIDNWNSNVIDLSILDISNKQKSFFEFGGKFTKGNIVNIINKYRGWTSKCYSVLQGKTPPPDFEAQSR